MLTQLLGSAGTLTENRMTVVAGWFAGQFYPQPPALDEMPKELQSAIEINSSMNSKVGWLSCGGQTSCMFTSSGLTLLRMPAGLSMVWLSRLCSWLSQCYCEHANTST